MIHGEKVKVQATQDREEVGEASGQRAQGQTREQGETQGQGRGQQEDVDGGPEEESGREKIGGPQKAVGYEEQGTCQGDQSRREEKQESRRGQEEARCEESCYPQRTHAVAKEASCQACETRSCGGTDK